MKPLPLLACLVFLLPPVHAEAPPPSWDAWATWADALHRVGDHEGHGPDVGSDEWASALSRQLGVTDAEGHGPDLKSAEWRAAVEKKLAARGSHELLSSHDTIAKFTGITDHKCMGLTALCPDKCGDSGRMATFEIVKYLSYVKAGEYGDEKSKEFQVLMEDNMKKPKLPAAVLKAINAFQPGTIVHLKWNHDYVTLGGSKFPERPILAVEPATPEQAAEAAKAKK